MFLVGRMQVGDHVKKWSYKKLKEVFGDKADVVAAEAGIKKPAGKKKEEEKGE